MNDILKNKYNKLIEYFKDLGSVAVAFSSGVDSTFLVYAASEAIPGKVIAITASSALFPAREKTESQEFCAKHNIEQLVLEVDELSVPGFCENPSNRCYICKKDLFTRIIEAAKSRGMAAVVEGSNLDDEGDYRPGLLAIKELKVKSPLREIGFTKSEIREISKELGLHTADKPSFACLASRIPYDEIITAKKLAMVEKAEQLLLDEGFKQFRVRLHSGDVARIELLKEDISRMLSEDLRLRIYDSFKEYGFSYVSLDLRGYRTGSLNEKILNN